LIVSTQIVPTRSRRWLWVFLAVGAVAAALLTWLAIYVRTELDPANQLNLEQLKAARKIWDEKGPKDYQMLYKVRRSGEKQQDSYFVEVRGGKVVSVVLNGDQRLEPRLMEYHSMTDLFNSIELFLKQDAEPNRAQIFCRGYFDQADGHLVQFVRRVGGTNESVDIRVETFKPIAAN
jgi:hypothetical protein